MEEQIFSKIVEIVGPFAKNKDALKEASKESNFLKDLQVSSSRLVDIILALEDTFEIEIDDKEADKVETIGAAVSLIMAKQAA
ncbi:MAG: acyl carrier protein [Proteobacteria bacterium]|nr:MAG: acyl carrier protein [Pseudomonadota bacterium]